MPMTFVEETFGYPKKITATWTVASGGGGAVSATTSIAYNGTVERLVTVPDASSAPAASYDITVSDQDSTDVLMGAGANRSAASTEQDLAASLGIVAYDKLTFKVTNAGSSSAGGTIYLYIV